MKPIRLHPEARAEFEAAVERYESLSAGLGVSFTGEIDAIINRISEMPRQFPVWHDNPSYRKAVLHETYPFIVFYRELDDHVRVLAVAHGAREPGYWKHRG